MKFVKQRYEFNILTKKSKVNLFCTNKVEDFKGSLLVVNSMLQITSISIYFFLLFMFKKRLIALQIRVLKPNIQNIYKISTCKFSTCVSLVGFNLSIIMHNNSSKH